MTGNRSSWEVFRDWLLTAPPHETESPTTDNEALTSWTGLLLVPLLALVGFTGVFFGSLWRSHLIVGILLVPVLGLKLLSTTYRAVRYYTGNQRYRLAGPPNWPARILAPFLIATTVVAMVSGVIMWLDNNRERPWSTIHTSSVVIMGVLVGIHILMYLPRAIRSALRDLSGLRHRRLTPGLRITVVSAVLVGGIVLGFATQPATPFPVHREGVVSRT